ncbi:hypothetical protein GMST_26460 [Geomonas silvestris]|uniref:Uncharacterized protein n=1 Tax=Geomonas silvestris TaxID=2740184 RepID=A0A6V8MJZ1_9BACT|nr:hypothetical protein GMST_26460 [Geomonas silvestris]
MGKSPNSRGFACSVVGSQRFIIDAIPGDALVICDNDLSLCTNLFEKIKLSAKLPRSDNHQRKNKQKKQMPNLNPVMNLVQTGNKEG